MITEKNSTGVTRTNRVFSFDARSPLGSEGIRLFLARTEQEAFDAAARYARMHGLTLTFRKEVF